MAGVMKSMRRGASSLQYAMVVGLLGVVALTAVGLSGGSINTLMGCVAAKLDDRPCEESARAGTGGGDEEEAARPTATPPSLTASITDGVSPGPASETEIGNAGGRASGAVTAALTEGTAFFTIAADGCAAGIAPGETCRIGVSRIAAGNDGPRQGTLEIGFADGASVTVPVAGAAAGFAPGLAWQETAPATLAPALGASPAPCTALTLRNAGTGASPPLTALTLTGAQAGRFQACAIGPGPCTPGQPLAAGMSCVYGARLTAAFNGSHAATAMANGLPLDVTASASGLAATGLTLAASSGNPAAMNVSAPGSPAYGASVTVTVTNAGAVPSQPIALSVGNAANFELTNDHCSGVVLPAAGSCTLRIRPKAVANGALSGALSIQTDNAPSLALSGTASGFSAAALTLTGANTGMNVTAPGTPAYGSTVTFTVTNTGGLPSAPVALSLSSTAGFEFFSDNCDGVVLGGGDSCTLRVRPKASSNGTLAANLCVSTDNAPCLALSGTASGFSAVSLAITGANTNMNVSAPGTPAYGSNVTFTVTNNGGVPSAPVAVSLSSTAGFEFFSNNCDGVVLGGGDSCTLRVRPKASTNGALAANLCVSTDNAPCIALSGTASGFSTASLSITGSNTNMNVSAPGTPAYGSNVTFTVTNNGGLGSSAVNVTLSNTSQFEIYSNGCAGTVLTGNGGSCTLRVRPKSSVNAALSANLCVSTDNAPCIALSGTASGFSTASLAITGGNTNMNVSAPGTPAYGSNVTFTVTNNGGLGSSAVNVTLSNTSQFEIYSNGCAGTVLTGNGGSCTLRVRPKSSVNAALSANLCVTTDNAPCIALSGTASGFSAASLSITGGNTNMNVTAPGTPAYGSTVTFTVTNNGGLSSAPVAVSLGNTANFDITSNGCAGAVLSGVGGSCTLRVRPKASVNGALSSTLCASNDNAPCIALSGTASGFSPANLTLTSSGAYTAMNVTGPGSPAYGSTITFTVANSGGLTSGTIAVNLGNTGNFDITSNGCSGGTLAGGGSCTFRVRPKSSGNGALSSSLCAVANNSACLTLAGTASGW